MSKIKFKIPLNPSANKIDISSKIQKEYPIAVDEQKASITDLSEYINDPYLGINSFKMICKTESGRRRLIDTLSINHCENWQQNMVPAEYVRKMSNLVKNADQYIVYFSLEFLESLIFEYRNNPDKIIFMGDNKYELQLAKSVYGVHTILFTKDIYNEYGLKYLVTKLKEKVNNMKFDNFAVIGNPPYQEEANLSGGGAQKPLYHKFIEYTIDYLKPNYISFIIPSRWMVGGLGLSEFRNRIMNDKRMKDIIHISDARKIFNSVDIKGGIQYFLYRI